MDTLLLDLLKLIVPPVIVAVIVAVVMNNLFHARYADLVNQLLAKLPPNIAALIQPPKPVTPAPAPAAAPIVADPNAGALIVPITPQHYADLCLEASRAIAGYRCGASWNELQYLRNMTPKVFAEWCSELAAIPDCAAATSAGAPGAMTNTIGWVQALSTDGLGIFMTLVSPPASLTIPAVDPRAT